MLADGLREAGGVLSEKNERGRKRGKGLAADVGGYVGTKVGAYSLSAPFASFGKSSSQPQREGHGAVVAERNERGRKSGKGLAADVGGYVGTKVGAYSLSAPFASFGKSSSQPQREGHGAVVAERNERGRKRGKGLAADVGGYVGTKVGAYSLSASFASFGKNSSQPQREGHGAVVAEKNERRRKGGSGFGGVRWWQRGNERSGPGSFGLFRRLSFLSAKPVRNHGLPS